MEGNKDQITLSERDIRLLNSKMGLKQLLKFDVLNIEKSLRNVKYEKQLKKLQIELLKVQNWLVKTNKKVIIIFEGRDAAGKGGAIRRMTHYLNPRLFNVIALPKPTTEEQQQWYFQRYVQHFPKGGEMVFFDRSWYNRAIVEPVNGFCTADQYNRFMSEVNNFEKMLISENCFLVKFYLSISKDEQQKRFNNILSDPLKKWKFSKVDSNAQLLWDEYTSYKNKMFESTNTPIAPWKVIKANKKGAARLEVIRHFLSQIPYEVME